MIRAALFMLGLALVGVQPAAGATLSNDLVRVELDERGLRALTDMARQATWRLERDDFALAIDGTCYEGRTLPHPRARWVTDRATYTWRAGAYRVDVVYEVKPGLAVRQQTAVGDRGGGGRGRTRVSGGRGHAVRPPLR